MLRSHALVSLAVATAAAAVAATAGCGPEMPATTSEADDPEASNPHNCGDLFAPELLPSFEIQISDADWKAMQMEFADWKARQEQNLDLKPYHPVVFKYGDEVVEDAHVKLQGNPSTSWVGDKMGFTISFNQIDRTKRFHGLRKIVLHASPSDKTLLRERLALSWMRLLGIPAQCENNARLVVNGNYYGVYENREALDDEFLDRVFPGEPHGDLWKLGVELDNASTPLAPGRQDAFMHMQPGDVTTLQSMADVDVMLTQWAAEAMLPDDDGSWAVNHNFYYYDHPTRGFLLLPYDKDATFDFVEFSADPITRVPFWSKGWGIQQQIAFADPAILQRFVDKVAQMQAAYDVDLLKARWQRWSAQIASSVAEDSVKPFSTGDQQLAVQGTNNYFTLRKRFVASWLSCYQAGSNTAGGVDADGDGFVWCRDCNDEDARMSPAAPEVCGNDVDENCNGRKDDCN